MPPGETRINEIPAEQKGNPTKIYYNADGYHSAQFSRTFGSKNCNFISQGSTDEQHAGDCLKNLEVPEGLWGEASRQYWEHQYTDGLREN